MRKLLAIFVLSGAIVFGAAGYELTGHIEPAAIASVSIYGATTPFTQATRSDAAGRFTFRGLPVGAYTVAVEDGARGEARRTFEVGPGTANRNRRVVVTIELDRASRYGNTISAKELAIPPTAWQKYRDAQRALSKPDVSAAKRSLNAAVGRAPHFTAAWNQLGTIAYQEAQYADAEAYFRRALEAEPEAFEPLVNLGGVLLNLERPAEALEYNRQAVTMRPGDSLANSQLGMSELAAGKLDDAERHLQTAKRIDPAHFSHPQLLLAQIHLRRGERAAAKAELEDFIQRHPDAPDTPRIREALAGIAP